MQDWASHARRVHIDEARLPSLPVVGPHGGQVELGQPELLLPRHRILHVEVVPLDQAMRNLGAAELRV